MLPFLLLPLPLVPLVPLTLAPLASVAAVSLSVSEAAMLMPKPSSNCLLVRSRSNSRLRSLFWWMKSGFGDGSGVAPVSCTMRISRGRRLVGEEEVFGDLIDGSSSIEDVED